MVKAKTEKFIPFLYKRIATAATVTTIEATAAAVEAECSWFGFSSVDEEEDSVRHVKLLEARTRLYVEYALLTCFVAAAGAGLPV